MFVICNHVWKILFLNTFEDETLKVEVAGLTCLPIFESSRVCSKFLKILTRQDERVIYNSQSAFLLVLILSLYSHKIWRRCAFEFICLLQKSHYHFLLRLLKTWQAFKRWRLYQILRCGSPCLFIWRLYVHITKNASFCIWFLMRGCILRLRIKVTDLNSAQIRFSDLTLC